MPAYVWAALHFALAVYSVYHALLYKRDPRSAMGWIMVCLLVPFAGPIAYFLFGINRVKLRARGLRRNFLQVTYEAGERLASIKGPTTLGLTDAGYRISGRSLSSGNAITPLHNGEAAYPAMLAAINAAKSQVLLAAYIFKHDSVGLEFTEALTDAAARGVDVKVLIDGVGELYSLRKVRKNLRRGKVKTARFLPPRLLPPSIYINLRNHRKLLIVDNIVAYAGGMNISQEHTSATTRPRTISDVHFALRGPVVFELAQLFAHDWNFATGKAINLHAEKPGVAEGDAQCRLVADGPDEEMDMLALTIQTAVSAAQQSVDIMTPYFLPSRELIASLQSAALRGVRVRIVLPAENNLIFVHWAHRNGLTELLQWDIEVFYQPPPFCHSKLLCVDSDYVLLGSANLDPRSLRLNFELGIEVFSTPLNRQLRTHFDGVIAHSKALSYEELQRRPLVTRLRDSAAALLSPYL